MPFKTPFDRSTRFALGALLRRALGDRATGFRQGNASVRCACSGRRRGKPLSAAALGLASALALGLTVSAADAQPGAAVEVRSDGSARYSVDPDATFQAESHLVTSLGTDIFSGSLVNDLIGADRFYNAGFDGGGTIASNIEAGHIWGTSTGHSSLTHVTQFVEDTSVDAGTQTGDIDRHATWVGQAIGGRPSTDDVRTGIAPGTDLRSGAIATEWSGAAYSLSFGINSSTFYTPYTSATTGFGAADVINGSYGLTDSGGVNFFTNQIDGLANANPETTAVFSAGNAGPSANTVGGPASGYNTIAVGALENDGNDNYDQIAGFSSRGPQDYADPVNGTVSGVRAAVDIAAPGDTLTLAYYGGQTGGNDSSLSGSPDGPAGNANTFSGFVAGTSFAAPIVAGGVALMHDAADAFNGGLPAAAHDARVIKANLLNAADKVNQDDGTPWDNGQTLTGNTYTTTQSLDYESGAGGLNLDRTFDQFLTGQTDIAGLSGGTSTEEIGWDFGELSGTVGSMVDVVLPLNFVEGTTFTATATWFRDRTSNSSISATDNAFADLDLEIWDSSFSTLLGESISDYNSVEHLNFDLLSDTAIGLRVVLDEFRFGTQGAIPFGLAWSGTSTGLIPEPSALALFSIGAVMVYRGRKASRTS